MIRVGFPFQEKDFSKIEKNSNICINLFTYENRLTFPIYIFQIKNYEGSYSKKYQDRVPCKFPYKHVCVDDKFSKPSVVFRV